MIDLVGAVQDVRVAVVAVLEVVGGGTRAVVVPLLLDDAAEAVQAGVLVAGVSRACSDVGQIDVGLGMGALDDGSQPKVRVTFQSARVVRERRQAADRGVHAGGVVVV
jgi:hypothetical protein